MRVFFAINLPQDIKTDLAKIQLDLKNACPQDALYWVRPRSFHITLQFISDMKPEILHQLIHEVAASLSQISSFELTLPSLELFPNRRRSKLISLTTEPHDLLTQLANAIGQAMKAIKCPTQERPFRGHLTLGHFTYNTRKIPFTLPTISTFVVPRFQVHEVILFHSELHSEGSRYHTLTTFDLGKPRQPF